MRAASVAATSCSAERAGRTGCPEPEAGRGIATMPAVTATTARGTEYVNRRRGCIRPACATPGGIGEAWQVKARSGPQTRALRLLAHHRRQLVTDRFVLRHYEVPAEPVAAVNHEGR